MDLRYAMRRLLLALIAAAVLQALLTGFFCPVVEAKVRYVGHLSFDYEKLSFRPLWRLEGRSPSHFWLGGQAFLALFVGFGVWFVYPQYKPSPPLEG